MAHVYEYQNLKNQIFYKNTTDVIYYTSDPAQIGVYEREWLNNLKTEIAKTSEFEHNVVVNLTWFRANWDETEPLRQLLHSLTPKESVKIWYAGSIDGIYWVTNPNIEFYHHLVQEGYVHSFVGYAYEHWHSWFPEWFAKSNTKVVYEDIKLDKNPKYLYLSYNRKPRIHREWLVNAIIDNQLLDRGWVTFEKGHYPEIDIRTADTDQEKHSPDLRYSRPEDIVSLGDLNLWRNSYMIVVSETDHNDPWQLSEKTWKPIFGLRPFLINGSREIYSILEKLGFYTPIDFFKNKNLDCHYQSVIKQIQALYSKTPEELYKMWEDQYEMLLYNKERMLEIAKADPSKILNWPQSKEKPYSVPVTG